MAQPEQPAEHTPVRVAVVHPHELVRLSLHLILGAESNTAVVLEAVLVEELEVALRKGTCFDVAIVHVAAPVQPLLDALARLRAAHPATYVLVLGELTSGVAALCAGAGARGLLPASVLMSEVKQAVATVAAGGLHANAWMLASVGGTSRAAATSAQRHTIKLTARQSQVLHWMAHPDGYTYERIAEKLEVGIRTIHTHRDELFRKFKVNSVKALIALAHELKYI